MTKFSKLRIPWGWRIALVMVAALSFLAFTRIVSANVQTVGYYSTTLNAGDARQVPPIVAAGFQAVDVGDLNTADLSQFDLLFVHNPSNSSYGSFWPANLQKVDNFVSAGGILIFHDRQVGNAEANLPGNPGNIVRDFADPANIDVLDNTTCVTNGPGGVINNTNLDGGGGPATAMLLPTPSPLVAEASLAPATPLI